MISLTIDSDGNAKLYDDTYDLTIHCESKEEQQKVVDKLQFLNSIANAFNGGKMTREEIIDYMYEHHVRGDFPIEDMADDFAEPAKETADRDTAYWIPNTTIATQGGEVIGDMCSGCREMVSWGTSEKYRYCPYCGRKMIKK